MRRLRSFDRNIHDIVSTRRGRSGNDFTVPYARPSACRDSFARTKTKTNVQDGYALTIQFVFSASADPPPVLSTSVRLDLPHPPAGRRKFDDTALSTDTGRCRHQSTRLVDPFDSIVFANNCIYRTSYTVRCFAGGNGADEPGFRARRRVSQIQYSRGSLRFRRTFVAVSRRTKIKIKTSFSPPSKVTTRSHKSRSKAVVSSHVITTRAATASRLVFIYLLTYVRTGRGPKYRITYKHNEIWTVILTMAMRIIGNSWFGPSLSFTQERPIRTKGTGSRSRGLRSILQRLGGET